MPILLATVFLDVAGFGIVLPLQPFFALQLGATPDLVTLVAAAYTAAQFVGAPFWGRQSDRLGRRPVLLVLIAGSATANLCLAFVDALPLLFAARALAGAVAGNILVSQAWVTDATAPDRRARNIGLVGAASGLGFACGPAIGGLLAGPSGAADAFQLPFLAAAAFSATSFVLALAGLRETVPAPNRAPPSRREGRLAGLRRHLARPQFALILSLAFMSPFVFSGMETVFALWSERVWGWGPEWNGYAYAFMGGAAVVTQGLLVGPLNAFLPTRRVIGAGGASALAGALWLVAAGSTAEVFAALFALIFGVGVAMNALTTLISTYAAPGERGTLLGIGQLASGSGRILGPALSGPLLAYAGDAAPFLVGAAVMAVMLGLSFRLRPPQNLDAAQSLDVRAARD